MTACTCGTSAIILSTKQSAKIIWYPQRDVDEDSCLLGCYAVSAGKKLPTFRRSVLLLFSGYKHSSSYAPSETLVKYQSTRHTIPWGLNYHSLITGYCGNTLNKRMRKKATEKCKTKGFPVSSRHQISETCSAHRIDNRWKKIWEKNLVEVKIIRQRREDKIQPGHKKNKLYIHGFIHVYLLILMCICLSHLYLLYLMCICCTMCVLLFLL